MSSAKKPDSIQPCRCSTASRFDGVSIEAPSCWKTQLLISAGSP